MISKNGQIGCLLCLVGQANKSDVLTFKSPQRLDDWPTRLLLRGRVASQVAFVTPESVILIILIILQLTD